MDQKKVIYKFGFWSGLSAFMSTVAFVVAQTLQLLGALNYPWDEILIYGFSFCIVIPLILEILALHYITADEKKFWSHAAVLFTVIYAVFVTANYVVQLATVIPATLKGNADKISVLVQTPHSLFWDFDAIGYIFMGLAILFVIPVFKKQGFQRWVRYSFFIHGAIVTPLITFVYFYPDFSNELLLIGIPWGLTAPVSMLLLAIYFRKKYKEEAV